MSEHERPGPSRMMRPFVVSSSPQQELVSDAMNLQTDDKRGDTMRSLTTARRAPTKQVGALAAIAAALLALLPTGSTTALAQAGDEGVSIVGTLPRFPADVRAVLGDRIKPLHSADYLTSTGGTLVAIPEARRLWQFYPSSNADGPTAIAVRDMDTLNLLHTFSIPVPLTRSTRSQHAGEWLHALDGGRRIFFAAEDTRPRRGRMRVVVEVDVKTHAQRIFDIGLPYNVDVPNVFTGPTQLQIPGGLEYDPYDDALLLLFGGPNIGASPTTLLHRIDLRTGAQRTRQLRTCSGELPTLNGTTRQLGGIVTREHVYFPCQRQGNFGAVVKVKKSELYGTDPTGMVTASEEEFVVGPAFLETAFADPVGRRIFLVTLSSEIWAYDITTSSFVGVVAGGVEGQTQINTGLGLDEQTGRLFLQSQRLGLGIAEGRFYPIPQARTFRQFSTGGQERIISDAKNNRILVLTGTNFSRADHYRIIDVGPAPVPPPPPDPDRNTADVNEQPGVTDTRYFASGTGFGVRTVLAKGILASPPAPALGMMAPTAGIFTDNINSKCGFTDRELTVGRVAKAEYDTGSASAEAVGVEVDERTKLDLSNVSRCDVTATNGGNGFHGIFSTDPISRPLRDEEAKETFPRPLAWARKSAACSSSAGDTRAKAEDSKNESPSKARVECPLPGDKLLATATGYLTGAVAVGRAETKTEIDKVDRAVVSQVVSEAQDIDIAGVIKIGRITAVAQSTANGRPSKDPMSTYTITIEGVVINNNVVCSKNCDMGNVLRALNTAAAGRAEFRSASGLDEGLLEGSRKGASTAVQKSVARQTSDQALTGDRSNEVAALEMVLYNDNVKFGRARQVFQFAGVATAATYNIAVLPTGTGFDDPKDDFDDNDLDAAFELDGTGLNDLLPDGDTLPPGVAAGAFSGSPSGNVIERVIDAVARGIRMFFNNPRHALLLVTAWSLFSLPGVLSRRRRLLAVARSE